jgi:hypothetical protein
MDVDEPWNHRGVACVDDRPTGREHAASHDRGDLAVAHVHVHMPPIITAHRVEEPADLDDIFRGCRRRLPLHGR